MNPLKLWSSFFAAASLCKPTMGAKSFPTKSGDACYFVTGDKMSHQRTVKYTVRKGIVGGMVRTVGDLAGWPTRGQAERQAAALADGRPGV